MKHLILLILLFATSLSLAMLEQTTIEIVIIVPLEWMPYIDWWLSFPGWQQTDEQPPDLQHVYQPVRAIAFAGAVPP